MDFQEISAHLSKFTVGIAGAGGLGSNCAVALARSGIGRIVLCDFDLVEASNLSRQYYFIDQVGTLKTLSLRENIKRINPGVEVLAHDISLDRNNIPAIFSRCDAIVEALDSAEMKELFIETVQTRLKDIPLIAGSGMAGWGETAKLKCRKIDETLYICGDETSSASDEQPLMAPRVAIVANMQANIVVEILMKIRK